MKKIIFVLCAAVLLSSCAAGTSDSTSTSNPNSEDTSNTSSENISTPTSNPDVLIGEWNEKQTEDILGALGENIPYVNLGKDVLVTPYNVGVFVEGEGDKNVLEIYKNALTDSGFIYTETLKDRSNDDTNINIKGNIRVETQSYVGVDEFNIEHDYFSIYAFEVLDHYVTEEINKYAPNTDAPIYPNANETTFYVVTMEGYTTICTYIIGGDVEIYNNIVKDTKLFEIEYSPDDRVYNANSETTLLSYYTLGELGCMITISEK